MVDIDRGEEEIKSKSEVIVDGDVSDNRIATLIKFQREEESLDYKEALDLTSNSAKKHTKIDLVCDIVSMANTTGGYILVGVKENIGGRFSTQGVDQDCIALLTQETIKNWLGNYVDATIRVLVRAGKYNGKDIVAICTFSAGVPVPFRQHGQYRLPKGVEKTKFLAGDLFVRHGSKSERAHYEDWLRMSGKIREDERAKLNPQVGITSRLDTIIRLLGGVPQTKRSLDLLNGSEDDIENQVLDLLQSSNPILIKHALKKEFDRLTMFLREQQKTMTVEELMENLDRTFIAFLHRLFPVWVLAIEYDSEVTAKELAYRVHNLYVKANKIYFSHGSGQIDSLWLQSQILYFVYGIGAYAVMQEKPELVRLLIERKNPFVDYWKNQSWFRYVLTMLSRSERLENKSLCTVALMNLKNKTYIMEIFEDEESLTDSICQFDFLQCAYALTEDERGMVCYPSYGAYSKNRIVPVVRKIIETRESGLWLPKVDEPRLAKIIDDLDIYANKQFGFWNDWYYGQWDGDIQGFLQKYKGNVTDQ